MGKEEQTSGSEILPVLILDTKCFGCSPMGEGESFAGMVNDVSCRFGCMEI